VVELPRMLGQQLAGCRCGRVSAQCPPAPVCQQLGQPIHADEQGYDYAE